MALKKCPQCRDKKSLSAFYEEKSHRDGHSSWCKDCAKKAARKRSKSNYLQRRNTNLIRKYNLTLAEYDKMFDEQDGVCYLCGNPNIRRRLCVDHRHLDRKIRKLLCDRCNLLIGFIEETPELLSQTAKYLEEHK